MRANNSAISELSVSCPAIVFQAPPSASSRTPFGVYSPDVFWRAELHQAAQSVAGQLAEQTVLGPLQHFS